MDDHIYRLSTAPTPLKYLRSERPQMRAFEVAQGRTVTPQGSADNGNHDCLPLSSLSNTADYGIENETQENNNGCHSKKSIFPHIEHATNKSRRNEKNGIDPQLLNQSTHSHMRESERVKFSWKDSTFLYRSNKGLVSSIYSEGNLRHVAKVESTV